MSTQATDTLNKCISALIILVLCCGIRPAHGPGPLMTLVRVHAPPTIRNSGHFLTSET